MLYEVSNQTYNHKLSEHEVSHNGPFQKMVGRGKKKTPQDFYLTKDTPENLLKIYQAGHCLKPHAFTSEDKSSRMMVNAIVLDFDHLTKSQLDFVKSISKYGDYSAGMKTQLHHNKDIPGWHPSEWKYKVFHPTSNCLCVYEDVDREFQKAVAFYNPSRTADEVKDIWTKWKRANNRKTAISNPIFNGWILPDVAMLNSYRTQITYSINVEQKEPHRVVEDEWICAHLPVGTSKFPSTGKDNYEGLDWKIEEAVATPPMKSACSDEHRGEVQQTYDWLIRSYDKHEDKFNLPLWKADFARRANKTHFDDLVLGGRGLNIIRAKVFSKTHAGHSVDLTLSKEALKKDAGLCARSFARVRQECLYHGIPCPREDALKDMLKAYQEIHGVRIYDVLLNKGILDDILREMASAYCSSSLNYKAWRLKQRVVESGAKADPLVVKARDEWRDSIGTDSEKELRTAFFKARDKFAYRRAVDWSNPIYNQPYDYHRRGFRSEVMKMLMDGEVKLNGEKEFVERMRLDISSEDGEYTDKVLSNWFKEYRRQWNATYPDNPIGRKIHKSRYDEIFKDMSKEEISAWIDNADIHRQMKKKLRRRYHLEKTPSPICA